MTLLLMSIPAERIRAAKAALRAELLAARRARSADLRAEHGRRLAAAALADPRMTGARCVTAYVGVGAEPATGPLLERLRVAGVTVLLPVVAPGGRLEWSAFDGPASLGPGPHGLLQPTGGRVSVAAADLLLVPALAVDRRGNRLGRGGGYYDRLLAGLGVAAPALALVYDDEVLTDVPAEPHDVPVQGMLTTAGVTVWA